MDIEIKDPSNGNIHTVEWNSPQSPKQEDVEGMLAQIQGQGQEPSLPENVVSDVKDIVKGLPMSIGQTAATAGKGALDLMTGASIRSMLPAGKSNAPINEPSILNMIRGKQAEAISEEPKYEPQNIGKTMYEHPLNNIPVMAATMAIPSFFKGKTAKVTEAPKSTLQTSKVLADRLGVQDSSIEALADPEMRKWMTPDLATKTEAIEADVLNSLKELPKGLSKAENQVYKNAGVTNETPTVWNKPILGDLKADGTRPEPVTPIENMRSSIMKYRETATQDELPIASKADEIVDKIIKDSTFDKDGNMSLSFGKAKIYSQKLWDLSQDDKLTNQGQRLFGQMYQSAKAAKNSVPEIQKAGNVFRDIENARETLSNSFRGFGMEGREFRAEKNIFSRYKDEGNVGFKENLDKVGEILSKYPETKELADFSKKVKLMNMAVDFAKAKTPATGTFGKIGRFLRPKPSTVLSGAARLTERGYLRPEALKGGTIPESTKTFSGKPINTFRAFSSVFKKPSILQMIRGGK